jgi:hypothetical protein
MTSKLDVINQALSYLGNPMVPSLLAGDPVISAMSQIYDAEKPNLLSWHPWRFATKWEELVPSTTPSPYPRFRYSYDLPADYIQAFDTYYWENYNIVGRHVLANTGPPWKWGYIFDVPDTLFPQYFTLALSHTVAAKAATLLTENPEVAKYWAQQASVQTIRAQNRDGTAVPAQNIRDNPMLGSHFFRGGASGWLA